MKITTTITINVSDENKSLIPMLVAKNGWAIGEETTEEAIIRLRNETVLWNAIGQIRPHVETYFWEYAKDKADLINSQLEQAIEVSTTIEE